jgi:hypothetical protein
VRIIVDGSWEASARTMASARPFGLAPVMRTAHVR